MSENLSKSFEIFRKEGQDDFNDDAGLAADLDVAKMGEDYAMYMKDHAMATMGDVMATKRLGEVKAGRRVVGRQKVNFRTLGTDRLASFLPIKKSRSIICIQLILLS